MGGERGGDDVGVGEEDLDVGCEDGVVFWGDVAGEEGGCEGDWGVEVGREGGGERGEGGEEGGEEGGHVGVCAVGGEVLGWVSGVVSEGELVWEG